MSLPRGDACSARHPWTPAEAAEYAVRRDVRLLQLLSSDRSAFRAARRLGIAWVCLQYVHVRARKDPQTIAQIAAAKALGDDIDAAAARGAAAELCTAPQCPPPPRVVAGEAVYHLCRHASLTRTVELDCARGARFTT